MNDSRKLSRARLSAAGFSLLALYLAPLLVPDYSAAVTPFLVIYLSAFAVWGVVVWETLRADEADGWALFIVVLFAILFRVVVLPQDSILDDDLYRYVWDGRMWLNGINPYLYPPSHSALAAYRDDLIFPNINFPHVPTIYPPLSQYVFAGAVGLFGGSLVGMKLFWTLFELLTIAAVAGLLKTLGRNPVRAVVYAWCPLAIKEVAGSGHLDSLAVFLTVIAVWMAARRPALSSAALGAAVAAKLYPLAIAPFFIRRLGWRFLIAPVVTLLAYAPFLSVGPSKIFAGLMEYADRWMFNPGLFDVARRVFSIFSENGLEMAKAALGLAVAAVIVWLFYRDDGTTRKLSESVMWTLAALLLAAPTADPWYLLWFLPFMAAAPSPALFAWTGLSFLSYGFYYEGRDIAWFRAFEYIPVYALLLWEAARRRKNP
ncbi:MAG: glycosyltransferase 87 family protein [Candidatus Nitrospinota bacterium M3_3B_026]